MNEVVAFVTILVAVGVLVAVPYNIDAARQLRREAARKPRIDALVASAQTSTAIERATLFFAPVAVNALLVVWFDVRIIPSPIATILLGLGVIVVSYGNVFMRRQLKRWEADDKLRRAVAPTDTQP